MTADAAVGSGIATVTINAIAGLGVSEGSGSKATGATGLDFVGLQYVLMVYQSKMKDHQ